MEEAILPEPLEFEWNEANQDKNWIKHKVSTKEAEEVFVNRPIYLFDDVVHSKIEKRYGILGITNKERKLAIAFAMRGNKIRIITARNMSRKERRYYESIKAENQKNT